MDRLLARLIFGFVYTSLLVAPALAVLALPPILGSRWLSLRAAQYWRLFDTRK